MTGFDASMLLVNCHDFHGLVQFAKYLLKIKPFDWNGQRIIYVCVKIDL